MSSSIQVYSLGSIGDGVGQIQISYTPEFGTVSLYATVPSDKRRSGISVQINASRLRALVDKLDEVVEIAKRAQIAHESSKSEAGGVSFRIMGTEVFASNTVLSAVKTKIDTGQNDAVIKEVRAAFPLLKDDAVKDLTLAIYKYFRPRV